MTAVLENGQMYFTFEESLENMTFDELENLVLALMEERKNTTSLNDSIDLSTKISLVLIQMNYKAWED